MGEEPRFPPGQRAYAGPPGRCIVFRNFSSSNLTINSCTRFTSLSVSVSSCIRRTSSRQSSGMETPSASPLSLVSRACNLSFESSDVSSFAMCHMSSRNANAPARRRRKRRCHPQSTIVGRSLGRECCHPPLHQRHRDLFEMGDQSPQNPSSLCFNLAGKSRYGLYLLENVRRCITRKLLQRRDLASVSVLGGSGFASAI